MRNNLTRIVFFMLLVLTLPLAIFFFREMTMLTENEKMIRKVFDKQLESILFSLNQQTETLMKIWSSRLDVPSEQITIAAKDVIAGSPSIIAIGYYQIENQDSLFFFGNRNAAMVRELQPNRTELEKLQEYIKSGFQKVSAVGNQNGTLLYFILTRSDKPVICQIWLETEEFIDQSVKPEIQKASQDMFVINVSKQKDTQTMNMLDTIIIDNEVMLSQSMLYLPGYQFNIRLKSKTIDELVSDRTKKDNLMLAIMFGIVLVGGFIIVRNMRGELKMAEMKAEFVSNVSHELRTPLALMSMYTETLLQKRLKSKEREEEYLEVIHRETLRLSDIVNRILNFSKMERGKREYHLTTWGINHMLGDVVGLYKPHFDKNKVALQLNLMPTEKYICADKEAVTESLINLLDNAIKYGRDENKTVEISSYTESVMVVVSVEDNGIGISHKHKGKIFDKFYRITEGNLAHRAKGSGLGLNIVQQIMKQHRGRVTVQSKLGEGSTFRLYFQIAKDNCDEQNIDS